MGKYRGERWELTYDVENAYGEAPTSSLTAKNLFGVFDSARLPDPSFDHQRFWMMNPANRNFYVAYKGRASCNGSIGDITLLDGRPLFLPIADTITHTGEGPYVHTINETINLPSIRLVATNISDEDVTPEELSRWFVGGKVGRATYSCQEGGMLKMALDDMQFKMPYYKAPSSVKISPWYDVDAVRQTFTYPCSEPYYFSQGSIKAKFPSLGMTEVEIPFVRSFSLSVSNSLQPRYYVTSNEEKVPYEIWEGRREYSLSLALDLVDHPTNTFEKDTPLLELLSQGMDSTTLKGAAIELTFTKGENNYIKFITPADYTPDCGGDEQGALVVNCSMPITTEGVVGVTMEMRPRNLKIEVKDSIAGTDYPV